MREINEIILHCSATKESQYVTIDDIRRWHKQKGYTDIGYNWVIDRNGYLCKGRDINQVPAHCLGHNKNSIGICYIGGLDSKGKSKDTRTDEQKKTMYQIVRELMNTYKLTLEQVHCHNEYAVKDCPCFKIEQFRQEYIDWEKNQQDLLGQSKEIICPHCNKPIKIV